MTKKEFLRKLEKKLDILSIAEREDTINEYSNIIDEKIAHGKSEEEAVKEAGNVDELAKEIIEAYKINPDYQRKDKTIIESTEDAIKKGAQKLSEVTEEVIENFKSSDFEFTTSNVFEIIIKIFLLLLGLAILKIPFIMVGELASSIFNFSILGHGTSIALKALLEFAYIAVCILIVIYSIKRFTEKSNNTSTTKKEEYKSEKKYQEEKPEKVKTSVAVDVVLLIAKIFIVICVIIPLFGVMIGLSATLAVLIYLLLKGVYAYGLIVLNVGIIGFAASFVGLIFSIMNGKKIRIAPFILSFIISIVGGLMVVDYIADFKYIDSINEEKFEKVTNTYVETINKETAIYYTNNFQIDNDLEDNQVRIEVSYYKDFVQIREEKTKMGNMDAIIFSSDIVNSLSIHNDILDDIKNQKVYNYSLLSEIEIVVYANENTLTKLK